MDELSDEQRLTVSRARKIQQFLSQSFHVAEKFTGNPGVYVRVAEYGALVCRDYRRRVRRSARAGVPLCRTDTTTCATVRARWGRESMSMHVRIVCPEFNAFEGSAVFASIPSTDGESAS